MNTTTVTTPNELEIRVERISTHRARTCSPSGRTRN